MVILTLKETHSTSVMIYATVPKDPDIEHKRQASKRCSTILYTRDIKTTFKNTLKNIYIFLNCV